MDMAESFPSCVFLPNLCLEHRMFGLSAIERGKSLQDCRQFCLKKIQHLSVSAWDKQQPTVVLVDDNMYYRSMRKQVLLFAKAGVLCTAVQRRSNPFVANTSCRHITSHLDVC
jgi:hypothetical protein